MPAPGFKGLVAVATSSIVGCSEPCEEALGAQVIDERVEIRVESPVGPTLLEAELADDATERERGWRKRRCGLEALWLQPPERQPLAVWGCELTVPLDVAFIRDDEIVALETLDPCATPCEGCPRIGGDVDVDAVLEVPSDTVALSVGMSVQNLGRVRD